MKRLLIKKEVIIAIIVCLIIGIILLGRYCKKEEKEERGKRVIHTNMMTDVEEVLTYVESVMRGDVIIEDKDNPLYRYSFKIEDDRYARTTRIELEVNMENAIHNNTDGYIWVTYTRILYDENSEKITSARGVPSMWKIHKEDNVWEVVDIQEQP